MTGKKPDGLRYATAKLPVQRYRESRARCHVLTEPVTPVGLTEECPNMGCFVSPLANSYFNFNAS